METYRVQENLNFGVQTSRDFGIMRTSENEKQDTTQAMRVLIVEDDKETLLFIAKTLAKNGFACDHAESGEDGLLKITTTPYDTAIVDITLVGSMSGLDLIKAARKKNVKTPIIVLSAMNEPYERTNGINCGADDYLGKPFAISELLARVMAQVRRSSYAQGYGAILRAKDLTLCRETHEVRRGGRPVDLTTGEYVLLELLMRNKGRTITPQMILQSVWGMDYVPSSKIVETRICAIRKKLCANGEPDMITTVRGFGYVLR